MLIKKTNETIMRTIAITTAKTFAAIAFLIGGLSSVASMAAMRSLKYSDDIPLALFFAAISFVLFFVPISYFFYLFCKRKWSEKIDEKYKDLKGFGGWLIFFLIASVFQFFNWIDSAVQGQMQIIIVLSLFFVFLYLAMFGMFLYKSKKVALIVGLIFTSHFFFMSMFGLDKDIAQSVILLITWPLYFVKSKRVRQTFVN
jgi:hypothetical protein